MENKIGIGYFLSPLGFIKIKEQNNKVHFLKFVICEDEKENVTPLILKAKQELYEYFNKERKYFDLPININGTPFQKKVYNALTKIPYGKTQSYNDVAVAINNGKAFRAVGNTNNKNQLFLLVPCHRVTRKDSNLSGTKEWIKMQKWLIEFEKGNL